VSDAAFDRDFTLGELIGSADAGELGPALSAALQTEVALLDADGARIDGGSAPPAETRAPLTIELEPLGYLAGAVAPEQLAGAARTVRWGMLARARYRMVTDLHLDAVRTDYARLQEKHAELQRSETRYRELAARLDAEVKAQLKVLDERQRQIYQAERLAAVGQLAAGVAHEINNPLGFALSNLGSGRRYLDRLGALKGALDDAGRRAWSAAGLDALLEDFAELIDETGAGLERIARIVTDLKGFSSVDQPEEQVADINALIESLCAVLGGQLKPGVVLHRELGDVPSILCLPGHLGQALLNVLKNALQAVGERGTVRIRSLRNGDWLRVQVIDDGVGMSDSVRASAFDPFFTTRGVGKGTGLGLTVARDIVLAHSGRIHLDSSEGKGTTVTMDLPT
jgi:signal transduction histidine kinase